MKTTKVDANVNSNATNKTANRFRRSGRRNRDKRNDSVVVDDDDITLAESIVEVHDNEHGTSNHNENTNNDTMITIINNVDNHNQEKEEGCFIQDFIRESIVRDMDDLALVHLILTKCRTCDLFTERQSYDYTVQALLKAFTLIDSDSTALEAPTTKDNERNNIQQQAQDDFYIIVDIVMQQQNLFSSHYKDRDDLMDFLQNESNAQTKGDPASTITRRPLNSNSSPKEDLQKKVDRIDKYLNSHDVLKKNLSTTFRIQAFCGIASSIVNTIASTNCSDNCHNSNNKKDDHHTISLMSVLTEITTETEATPQELLPVYKIRNFGDKEQISRAIQACINVHKKNVGLGDDIVQSSIDYVNSLDLSWIVAREDVSSTMVTSVLLKNQNRDSIDNENKNAEKQIQDRISLVETIVELQVTMINVILVQLDKQSNNIEFIVKVMKEHPCVASIQELALEKLANFSTDDTISYEMSQAAATAVVDAMSKHEDISNVQTFGVAAMLSLRTAMMLPSNPIANRDVEDERPTCFSKLLKFCC